jgi:hypothetical protein
VSGTMMTRVRITRAIAWDGGVAQPGTVLTIPMSDALGLITSSAAEAVDPDAHGRPLPLLADGTPAARYDGGSVLSSALVRKRGK